MQHICPLYRSEATAHDRSTTAVIGICTACGQPAVDDPWQTKSKLPRVLQLESSQLSVTDAHFTITHRAGSS